MTDKEMALRLHELLECNGQELRDEIAQRRCSMPKSEVIRKAIELSAEQPITSLAQMRAITLANAVHELTGALEDAITGCANPRQKPGEVLEKYKEALDET